jgi:hypothetical protein
VLTRFDADMDGNRLSSGIGERERWGGGSDLVHIMIHDCLLCSAYTYGL